MNRFSIQLTAALFLTGTLAFTAPAAAQEEDAPAPFVQAVTDAMAAPGRDEGEVERDANRLPAETLEFLGLDQTMRVVELIPGTGWYTKLLAPALHEQGTLYLAIATGRVEQAEWLGEAPFDRIEILKPELEIRQDPERRLVTVDAFSLGVENVDAVLTFRNLHNFTEVGRANLNQAAFDALKPGGIYGVVDHTRRHMQPDDPENRRRVDPVQMVKEIQAAGFEFEDYSTLHYRPDDELRFEVGRRSVTGNTDRFTFRFRKPAE